jgi:hypothetical protein
VWGNAKDVRELRLRPLRGRSIAVRRWTERWKRRRPRSRYSCPRQSRRGDRQGSARRLRSYSSSASSTQIVVLNDERVETPARATQFQPPSASCSVSNRSMIPRTSCRKYAPAAASCRDAGLYLASKNDFGDFIRSTARTPGFFFPPRAHRMRIHREAGPGSHSGSSPNSRRRLRRHRGIPIRDSTPRPPQPPQTIGAWRRKQAPAQPSVALRARSAFPFSRRRVGSGSRSTLPADRRIGRSAARLHDSRVGISRLRSRHRWRARKTKLVAVGIVNPERRRPQLDPRDGMRLRSEMDEAALATWFVVQPMMTGHARACPDLRSSTWLRIRSNPRLATWTTHARRDLRVPVQPQTQAAR